MYKKEEGKSEEECLYFAIFMALRTQWGEKINEAKIKANKKARRKVSEKDHQARLINLAKARAARLEAKSKKVSVEEAPEIKKSNESIATSLLRDLLNQPLLSKFTSFRQ